MEFFFEFKYSLKLVSDLLGGIDQYTNMQFSYEKGKIWVKKNTSANKNSLELIHILTYNFFIKIHVKYQSWNLTFHQLDQYFRIQQSCHY